MLVFLGFNDSLNNTQIISLISVALSTLTFIGTMITIYFNHKTNVNNNKLKKEINDNNNKFQAKINNNNNEFQKKINNSQIDAQLKSQSRINWINKVQYASSDLISSLHDKYIFQESFKGEPEKLNKYINEVWKNEMKLLMLFPNIPSSNNVDIMDIHSNEGKNDKIINFVTNMVTQYDDSKNQGDLIFKFINIISIYLKIEWDRAKKGK